MSDFKAKMYQIQFRHWGSLQRSLRPPSWIKGPTSKGKGGNGKGRGREREGRVRKGRGGTRPHHFMPSSPNPYFWICPCKYKIYYTTIILK